MKKLLVLMFSLMGPLLLHASDNSNSQNDQSIQYVLDCYLLRAQVLRLTPEQEKAIELERVAYLKKRVDYLEKSQNQLELLHGIPKRPLLSRSNSAANIAAEEQDLQHP